MRAQTRCGDAQGLARSALPQLFLQSFRTKTIGTVAAAALATISSLQKKNGSEDHLAVFPVEIFALDEGWVGRRSAVHRCRSASSVGMSKYDSARPPSS